MDFRVINDNLEELLTIIAGAPDTYTDSVNIFVSDRLYRLNSTKIDYFVEKGARQELYQLDYGSYKVFRSWKINDLPNVTVLTTYPSSPDEHEMHLGTFYFSTIAFNADSSTAMYIYDFSRFGKYPPKGIGYVESDFVNGHWKIVKWIGTE